MISAFRSHTSRSRPWHPFDSIGSYKSANCGVWSCALISFDAKALKRRAKELSETASKLDGADRLLLQFYAVECGLKAVFMLRFNLRNTHDSNSASSHSAVYFSHDLDKLIRHLKVGKSRLPSSPGRCVDRNGNDIGISELHQVWRYGGVIQDEEKVLEWLGKAAKFASEELQ